MPSSLKQWFSTPDAAGREVALEARTGGHLRVPFAVAGTIRAAQMMEGQDRE